MQGQADSTELSTDEFLRSVGAGHIVDEAYSQQKGAKITSVSKKLAEPPIQPTEESQMAKLAPTKSDPNKTDLGKGVSGIMNGAIAAVGEMGNSIVEGAAWVEDLAAKAGVGTGEIIQNEKPLKWENVLGLPSNHPDVIIGQHIGKVGAVLATSYGAGAVTGSKAIAYGTEAAVSYLTTDPEGENFASMVRDGVPSLRNATALYAALDAMSPTHTANPNDKEATQSEHMKNRFKGMLEGLGIRAMLDATMWGISRYSKAKHANAAINSLETGSVPVEKNKYIPSAAPKIKPGSDLDKMANEVVDKMADGTPVVKPPAVVEEAPLKPVVEPEGIPVPLDIPTEDKEAIVQILGNELNFKSLPPKPDEKLIAGARALIATEEAQVQFIKTLKTWDQSSRVGIGAEELLAARMLLEDTASNRVLKASKSLSLNPDDVRAAAEMAEAINEKTALKNAIGAFEQPVGQELRANQLAEAPVTGRSLMQDYAAKSLDTNYKISKSANSLERQARKIYQKELTKLSGGQSNLVAIANANKVISQLPDARFYKQGQEVMVRSTPAMAANEMSRIAINGMLKASTSVTATLGNTISLGKRGLDNYVAAVYSKTNGADARTFEEANAFMHGTFASLGEAFTAAWKSLRTGEGAGPVADLVRIEHQAEPLARRIGMYNNDHPIPSLLAKAVDKVGVVSDLPSRLLLTSDTFFSTLHFRGAQFMDQARHGGMVNNQQLANLAEQNAADARWYVYNARMNEMKNSFVGDIGGGAQNFLNSGGDIGGPLANSLFPFLRATVNGVDAAIEQNPFSALAKAVIAAPKSVERYDYLARATTSGAVLGGMAWAMHHKYLTGDTDFNKANASDRGPTTGDLPLALDFGGVQVSLQKLDPMKQLALTSQLLNAASSYMTADQYGQLADVSLATVAKTFTPHMLMDSAGRFFDAVGEANSASGTNKKLETLAAEYAARFVPVGGILEDVAELADGYKASTKAYAGFNDRLSRLVLSKLPGASRLNPMALNIWGEPIRRGNGMFDLVNPFQVSTIDEGTDFERRLKDLNNIHAELKPFNPDLEGIGFMKMPPEYVQFPSGIQVPLDAEEYNKYVSFAAGAEYADGKFKQSLLKESFKDVLSDDDLFKNRTIIEYNRVVAKVGDVYSRLMNIAGKQIMMEPSVAAKHDEILKRQMGEKVK